MIDYKDFLCKDSRKFSNQKIRYMSEGQKQNLIEKTSFFSLDTSLLVRLIALRDGFSLDNLPICGYCKKIVNRIYQGKMIRYCGPKCYSQTTEFKEQLKKVDHQQANINRRQTMLDKYGVEFNSQREEVKEKLGTHCSSEQFKTSARMRGFQQYNHIDRDIFPPQKISEMNLTMTAPEIAEKIGSSPSFVLQSLKKIGLNGRYHFHSKQESSVKNLLTEQNIKYQENDRSLISPKELDIWIPEHELAIEINGVYWHSELAGGKDKNYHLNKTLECEKIGIHLLQFWDYEIETRWDIVKSMILSKCGIYEKRIGARKCQIEEVLNQKEKEFLYQNHIQGYIPSTICYGLYHQDELVSLMSFGKPRFNKKVDWELLRFASKAGYQVIGGASRLFSRRPKGQIVSYADRRYSRGETYNRLGFLHTKFSDPSYHYTQDYKSLENRVKFQKHKLPSLFDSFNPDITEWQNMQINGYDRIWDCGSIVFECKTLNL